MRPVFPLLLIRLLLFLLFVLLVREFWWLLEADGCLDGGGQIVDDRCIDPRHGNWALAGSRHYASWLLVLGIPAVLLWLAGALLTHWLQRRQ